MIKWVAVAAAFVLSLDAAVIAAEPKAMDGVVLAGVFPYSQEQDSSEEVDETQLDEDDTWVSEESDDFEADEEYSDCDQAYCEEGSGCDC